jgi:AAA domain, putative AbiEii toxin, Type IV TA system
VLLRWVEAEGFLSFGERVRLDVGPSLTVVTGPNAAGKSNLGRCLDVARAVVESTWGDEDALRRLSLYEDAGYEGAEEFAVRLGVDLYQEWERDLVHKFVCACFASGSPAEQPSVDLDGLIVSGLERESLAPLWSGTLVIRHRAGPRPWSAAWEFTHREQAWHVALAGAEADLMRRGTAERPGPERGGMVFVPWLMGGNPRKSEPDPFGEPFTVDFGLALSQAPMSASFRVMPPGDVPGSARELGALLGIDPAGRSIGFGRVLGLVLRRGMVLTDNRRLPLTRVFPVAELGGEPDLRDGSAVAAELFRLKMGAAPEVARFREVQAMFRSLTGRDLEVRARPAPGDDGSMIVEPTVSGFHGERLVELSGAGVQEALVLSALLGNRPGRVTVLDEPAVNLEPTAQRRLVGRVRGPGQFLVITHSADLVPFDDPDDMQRIVRVSPGREGSLLRRPDFSWMREQRLLRQLQLMEPAEVRGLLFAAGVILCEGMTEVGALPRWWPGAEAENVPLIHVDGHSGYGPYLRYLEAWGIPWAVLSDGPALRAGSKLADDVREAGRWPGRPEPDRDDFEGWRVFWQEAGVFTLADGFGDDGGKGGELEALLVRTDPGLFAEACRVGGSKSRAGRYFALKHRFPPPGVSEVYSLIAAHLGLRR